ncbi:MAG: hypothetical protein HYV47_01535 [Candidatus Nealsonbacteria bacterium]|nr:hypothetical protein [Candidatus Nealsonbacteria bacterium]
MESIIVILVVAVSFFIIPIVVLIANQTHPKPKKPKILYYRREPNPNASWDIANPYDYIPVYEEQNDKNVLINPWEPVDIPKEKSDKQNHPINPWEKKVLEAGK